MISNPNSHFLIFDLLRPWQSYKTSHKKTQNRCPPNNQYAYTKEAEIMSGKISQYLSQISVRNRNQKAPEGVPRSVVHLNLLC